MANNYLEFSQVLPNLRAEEESWLTDQLVVVYVFGDHEYTEETLPEECDKSKADWLGPRVFRDLKDYTPDYDGWCGFEYAFEEGVNLGTKDWGRCFWVYAEERGEPEFVAHLVQKYLRMFRANEYWELSYAATCGKPCIGAFGGGAVFVTADGFEHMNDLDFCKIRLIPI